MENDIFVDTNILIHSLDGYEALVPLLDDKVVHVSFVTEMELLSKYNITKTDIRNINMLVNSTTLTIK